MQIILEIVGAVVLVGFLAHGIETYFFKRK